MRIEVKGRNLPVSDDLREHVDKRFRKVSRQVSELAELEVEVFEERNPAIADSQVAEATLHLKGVTLRARDASPDIVHSINLCADELAVQVKRHRDKRRKRRESRAARERPTTAARAAGDPSGRRLAGRLSSRRCAVGTPDRWRRLRSPPLCCSIAAPRRGAADLRVRGNRLVDGPGRGHTVQLRGVNRSGLEYACIQGWGFFDSPHPDQIDDPAMIAAMKSWDINVVRVPLNEDCWLGINAPPGRGGAPYRRIVERYVARAGAARPLRDPRSALGRPRRSVQAAEHRSDGRRRPRAGVLALGRAARSSATTRSSSTSSTSPTGSAGGAGCTAARSRPTDYGAEPAYRAAGMQQLVDAVRSTGARQPLMLGGLG